MSDRQENAWPKKEEVAAALRLEAEQTAKRLGHTMSGWVMHQNTGQARCITCLAVAVVSPRAFRSVPIKGEAVAMRCIKKK